MDETLAKQSAKARSIAKNGDPITVFTSTTSQFPILPPPFLLPDCYNISECAKERSSSKRRDKIGEQ